MPAPDQKDMEIVWPFADVGDLSIHIENEDAKHDLSILAIEGNIAAGKSTMVRRLGEIQDAVVRVVAEPLPPTECLSALYADRKKHALNAQMFFLYHRGVEILKVWHACLLSKAGSIMILDRGFVGDSLFAELLAEEGCITEEEMIPYRDLASTITDVLPPVSGTWLLQVSPQDCLNRVARRARQGEAKISLDYLSKLGDAHALKMMGTTDIHVLSNTDCEDAEAISRAKAILQTATPAPKERASLAAFQRAVEVIGRLKPRFERKE